MRHLERTLRRPTLISARGLDFAPRYPVWLKVWFGDEEFPASGHLFVDASAPRYLTIEDAVTVGALILDGLTGAGHWTE